MRFPISRLSSTLKGTRQPGASANGSQTALGAVRDASRHTRENQGNYRGVATGRNPAVGNQVAEKPHAARPLLVRTRRSDHRLDGGTEYRVGRDPAADIVLDDPRVSWHHATLRTDGRQWVLEDMGSTNGTFVGAERTRRVDILANCVVRLGNPEDGPVLRFEPQRPPAPAPESAR